MPNSWLLMLGSNLESDERVRAALAALRALGSTKLLTAIRRLPAHGDANAADYYNALALLESESDRTTLVANLKHIERELGRVHGSGRVAIDIDLLACRDGSRWIADPHALEKNEFGQLSTSGLITDAGMTIEIPGDYENT